MTRADKDKDQNILDRFLNSFPAFFLAVNQWGARLRVLTLFGAALTIWTILAFTYNPITLADLYPQGILYNRILTTPLLAPLVPLAPFTLLLESVISFLTPYFKVQAFRHMMFFGVAGWLAYRMAARYLDDIFELENTNVAEEFIRRAAFGIRYGRSARITIRNGAVAERDLDSPINKIGGPGMVMVHMENVGLFEKIDGRANILGQRVPAGNPEGGRQNRRAKPFQLEGFERLRKIFMVTDLHHTQGEIQARTRDGLRVKAKDVRVLYNLHRGDIRNLPQSDPDYQLKLPYRNSKQAIKNLEYKHVRDLKFAVVAGLEGVLQGFIRSHTLNDFLSYMAPHEYSAPLGEDGNVLPPGVNGGSDSGTEIDRPEYYSRDQITDLYRDMLPQNTAGAEKRGYEIQWVGVGTWEIPEIIPNKQHEAWTRMSRNRLDGSERELFKLRREARLNEIVRIIQDTPLNAFGALLNRSKSQEFDEKKAADIQRDLLGVYYAKLIRAKEQYDTNAQETPPGLTKALQHIKKVLMNTNHPPTDT